MTSQPLGMLQLILLLIPGSYGCLPTGLGGILGGGGGCPGRPGGCAAAAAAAPQYAAPLPPAMYAFTPQVYSQPPPPPPPPPPPAIIPAPAPARHLPSEVVIPVSAASSYQGMYQDRPQAPSINPDYQGTAPLSFAGEIASSEDPANTVLDPLKYIEHVSVSHTPSIQVGPPIQESYPPSPAPADPFQNINVPEEQTAQPEPQQQQKPQQIQVAPSSASTEDTYLPGPPEKEINNATRTLSTYYNQLCTGDKITVGEKETISSATKKCELLKCVAANAMPDSHGSYTVTYLRNATSRSNSKGNYCLSMKELPVKSKRVIRKFDEMMTSEESTNAVRRKIFKL
ncbi:hypothetical protein CAEBREN_29734 [Caenorhabditis brenneri]|uniref:Uncharacterized protein n=1 Tax=Caenorhabditis brenneri TaxID=135651 RepID=G0P8J4_CAEBE|nr:hypothetical protein CAEBREN_29734 [Caenorhabditis brenneri]